MFCKKPHETHVDFRLNPVRGAFVFIIPESRSFIVVVNRLRNTALWWFFPFIWLAMQTIFEHEYTLKMFPYNFKRFRIILREKMAKMTYFCKITWDSEFIFPIHPQHNFKTSMQQLRKFEHKHCQYVNIRAKCYFIHLDTLHVYTLWCES